jgi:RimJ/RimL family protein N-acetyltransferase
MTLNTPVHQNGFTFVVCENADSYPDFRALIKRSNAHYAILDESKLLNEQQSAMRQALKEKMKGAIRRLVFVLKDDVLVGWCFGLQKDSDTFEMINSGIISDYRRQGLYSQCLDMMVNHVAELGFQKISSRHHPNNNAVLIPKLKKGFVITGMEMSDNFGMLVHLTYFLNQKRANVYDVRTGWKKPDVAYLDALNAYES